MIWPGCTAPGASSPASALTLSTPICATPTWWGPRWPASPVLVEVSLAGREMRPAVVGLGLAGRSHFSLCVAPHPEGGARLLFEAACRIHEPAGWLGSTYRGPDGGLRQVTPTREPSIPPATVCWRYTIDATAIEAEPLPARQSPAAGR